MRKTKKVTRHYEAEVVEFAICDVCGRRDDGDNGWADGPYDAVEVEVRLKEGSNYPDGGSGTEIKIDICPTCFRDRLIAWVLGHDKIEEVKEERWDY